MIPIYVYLIIIVVEAIIIAVVIHKGIRQVERANYWKEEFMKSEKVVKAIQGLQDYVQPQNKENK